jgi:CheY-like chemotaxis protein
VAQIAQSAVSPTGSRQMGGSAASSPDSFIPTDTGRPKQNAYLGFALRPISDAASPPILLSATQLSKAAVKMNVFIVEDHPAVRQGIVETINREADLAVCGEADDLQPALAGIEAAQPQLVLTDIQLKSSSGLELIRLLNEKFTDLPVIAMTMFDPVRYERQARAAGATAFFVKQEGAAKMLEILRRVLFG